MTGLGRAFSGEAAIGDDASVLASNPAGIILLDDTAVSVGLSYIRPSADARGTATFATPFGEVEQEVSSSDVGDEVVVPSLYITHKINDDLSIGFGTFTTYGLSTDYEFEGFSGSTPLADTSTLESVNANLALAYRLNSKLTLGIGANVLYADGRLNSTTARGPGQGPFAGAPSNVRVFNLEGDDLGYGYNIGVLYELSEGTRFGLHYRSAVDLKLEGETDFAGVPGQIAPSDSADTTLSVTLPETIELSAYHEINRCWAVHGDIVWTRWSRYNGLSPQVSDRPDLNLVLDRTLDSNYQDVFRYSIGATYKPSDRLALRTGLAYDESPINNNERDLRIPDQDRFWLSFGASYAISENWNLDAAYTHIFVSDATINAADGFEGEVSGDVDIFALGVSGTF